MKPDEAAVIERVLARISPRGCFVDDEHAFALDSEGNRAGPGTSDATAWSWRGAAIAECADLELRGRVLRRIAEALRGEDRWPKRSRTDVILVLNRLVGRTVEA